MKVKRHIAITSLIICMIASVAFAFYAQMPSKAMAEDLQHTLSFDNYSAADNLATEELWGSDNYDSAESVVKMTKGADSVFVQSSYEVNVEVGKTYHVRFELKTTENMYANFVINPKWIVLNQGWTGVENNLVWESDITITEDIGSNQYFAVQLTAGSGDLYIKNFTFTEKIADQTVTENVAIGTLPAIPTKSGYKGYWTIDGKEITADSVYDYTEDKIATLVYAEAYTLSFDNVTNADNLATAELWGSDNYDSAENAVKMTKGADNVVVQSSYAVNVEVGKTYHVRFELKTTENMYANFVINPKWIVLNQGWTGVENNLVWENDITITEDIGSGQYFAVQLTAGSGDLYIKNFTFTEKIENQILTADATIGNLPEIPEKIGYKGYWTIDGIKITEGMSYTFGADKTAKLVYEVNKYKLIVGGEEIEVTYGERIGDLPEVPARANYRGYWKIDDTEITADTIYNYDENKTAEVGYELIAYILSFDNSVNALDMASSTEHWKGADNTYSVPSISDGVAILNRANGTVSYATKAGEIKLVADKAYVVKLDMKADADLKILFATENEWTSLTSGWVKTSVLGVGADEFKTLTFEYIANANFKNFIIQINEGEGNLYVRNFTCTEKVEEKYYAKATASTSEIGTLPEIPEKKCYRGYWAIDGKEITETTLYTYNEDKTAVLKYIRTDYLLTLEADTDLIETATFETANASYEKQTDGSLNVTYSGVWTGLHFKDVIAKEAVKYRLSFEIKHIGSDTTARRLLVKQLNSSDGQESFEFFTGVNNADYTKITYEFTSSGAGDFLDLEEATEGEINNSVYNIKNVVLTEIIEVKISIPTEGNVIVGILPEIPEKTGYHGGAWKIGETAIKAGDVYNFAEDKVAKLFYIANEYKLTVNGAERTVTYDSKIGNLPDIEERTGYTGYWTIDGEKITSDVVWKYTENKSAELIYEANKYTLTVGDEEIEVTYGEKIGILPDVPEQTGKRGYWKIGETEIDTDTVWNYTENKTATAAYSDVCVVKFDGVETTESYVVGDKIKKPSDPTKASTAEYDYIFDGWYTVNGKWDFDNDTLSGNVELESQFKQVKRSYMIRFNVSGKDGVTIPDMKVEYGKTVELVNALEGIEIGEYTYVFKIDGKEVTSVTVNGDVNVEVVFTAKNIDNEDEGCFASLSASSMGLIAILVASFAVVTIVRKKEQK